MEVALVNPTGVGSWQADAIAKQQYMFPYSIVFIKNYLDKQGIPCRIFDLFDSDPAALYRFCSSHERPVIGLTSDSYERFETIGVIKQIKYHNPGAICVVGGKHFSFCAEDTLIHVPEIDFVVRGEGERTFHELVSSLSSNSPVSNIQGISFRSDGQIIHNRHRPPEKDLERFMLDFRILQMNNFQKGVYLRNFENEKIRALPLHLARGCSRKCGFCSFGLTPYRSRDIESVLNDIYYLKDKYDCNYFLFVDPSFCERKEFVKEFCARLINENVGIKWWCEARVDTSLNILELMVKAGCISLDFAIESGSDRILKSISKGINIPQALAFAKECKNLGLRCLTFFMVSLPDETEADALETLRVAESISQYTKYIVANATQILPGTTFEKLAREREILPNDFSWYDEKFNHDFKDLALPTMPLYIENLSVDFIRDFLARFQFLKDTRYTNLADLKRMVRKGLQRIPEQTISEVVSETLRFGKVLMNKLRK